MPVSIFRLDSNWSSKKWANSLKEPTVFGFNLLNYVRAGLLRLMGKTLQITSKGEAQVGIMTVQ